MIKGGDAPASLPVFIFMIKYGDTNVAGKHH